MPEGITPIEIDLGKSATRLKMEEKDLVDSLTKLVDTSLGELAVQNPGKSIRLDLKVGTLHLTPGKTNAER